MIRTGRASDISGITHVRTSVVENHLSVAQMAELGITAERTSALIEDGTLGCWVAEENGRIIAFSMADRRDGGIFALFVLPGHEGRGLGAALLSRCEDWLRALGFGEAWLSTGAETRAFGFYVRQGWQPTGERSGPHGIDADFRKSLKPVEA